MSKCVFQFDVIVVGIDTPDQKFPDINQLTVQVNFNNIPIQITASRINTTEFQSGRNLEFTEDPEILRRTLDICGLPVVLRYSGFTIGNGTLKWPSEMTKQISAEMSDITHVGLVELKKGPSHVGSIEILCRLVAKCTVESRKTSHDTTRNLDEAINPQDILFVVGESQKSSNPCDPCIEMRTDEDQ